VSYVDAPVPRRTGKEVVSEYSSDSNTVPDYNSDTSYKFDFGLDPNEPKPEFDTTEQLLLGTTTVLVITSTPADRFVYWPNCKPPDLINDNPRCVAYLETLPFQEGTPLTPVAEEYSSTEVATTDSVLCMPDREVFVATAEAKTMEARPDR
jgi:hypothetical protein